MPCLSLAIDFPAKSSLFASLLFVSPHASASAPVSNRVYRASRFPLTSLRPASETAFLSSSDGMARAEEVDVWKAGNRKVALCCGTREVVWVDEMEHGDIRRGR